MQEVEVLQTPRRCDELQAAMESPPPYLSSAYVIEFAYADDSVIFEQRRTLNVGGEWLGRVPCLAICREFGRESEFLIAHCDEHWGHLGVAAGYASIEDAKSRVERSYHGISSKWVKSDVPMEEACARFEADLRAGGCSFCGRVIYDVRQMVGGDKVRICNVCVDEFYEAMHDDRNEP